MSTNISAHSNHTDSSVDRLCSALIETGLPSSTIDITQLPDQNTLFVSQSIEPEMAFVRARWVWIVSYDARFVAETHCGVKGFALSIDDLDDVISRLQPVGTPPVTALKTYFLDFNINPAALSVELDNDYISTSERKNELTVSFAPSGNVPEEVQKTERDGWEQACNAFQQSTDNSELTVSVATARETLNAYFTTQQHEFKT